MVGCRSISVIFSEDLEYILHLDKKMQQKRKYVPLQQSAVNVLRRRSEKKILVPEDGFSEELLKERESRV